MAESDGSSFSFVHAADLHLDTPFKGIHEAAPHVADALREASLEAFDAIVGLALERSVAFVLVAGDVYDGAERGLRAQLRFRDGLQRLADAGIPSFVVHGNHDPVVQGWSAIGSSWPPEVTMFGCDGVEVVPVLKDGRQIATIQGISYARKATTENLALRFSRPSGPGIHIGLLHCNVQGGPAGYDNYSPCTLDDLRRTKLDYLALGHVHQRRILSGRAGGSEPWIVYPGNSQARSPRHGEQEAKGALIAHVHNAKVTDVEFVACDRVRFAEVAVPITGIADLGELEDHLMQLANDQLERADGRSVVLRARLTGRAALHADLARAGSLDELVRRLRETTGNAYRFCWWDEIIDQSALEIDRTAVRGRGDFLSDLLDTSDELAHEQPAQEVIARALIGEAPRAFTHRLESLLSNEKEFREFIDQATEIALDALGVDGS